MSKIDDDLLEQQHKRVRDQVQKEEKITRAITAAPGKTKQQISKSFPIVLSFSEGDIAGTLKFVKMGDTYTDNLGKAQRYPQTKIVISIAGRKENITITEVVWRYLTTAMSAPDVQEKLIDWFE
jgi:hypothetical protein